MELKTKSGTTSGNGNLSLSEYTSTSVVLAAWTTDNNATVCTPYITAGGNQWGVHARNDNTAGAVVANTSLTVKYVIVPVSKLH